MKRFIDIITDGFDINMDKSGFREFPVVGRNQIVVVMRDVEFACHKVPGQPLL